MSGALKAHIVRQGEYVTQLAFRFGLSSDDLWNHPHNAELKARRRHMDILCPGDILFIPEAPRSELPLQCGVTNRFSAKVPKVPLTLRLLDGSTVLKNEPCVLRGLGDPIDQTTDGEGQIHLEVPLHIREITVELPAKALKFHVLVGDLDCIQEDSGVMMRLSNLGHFFPSGDPGSAADAEAMTSAIFRFQEAQRLELTGILDDATRAALITAHGS